MTDEKETCTYCGRLPENHGHPLYDHKPIMLSQIFEEVRAKRAQSNMLPQGSAGPPVAQGLTRVKKQSSPPCGSSEGQAQ